MARQAIYNWERTRAALAQLHDLFPGLLENIVLIRGGACWFYRQALMQWADSDFQVPSWTREEDSMVEQGCGFYGA